MRNLILATTFVAATAPATVMAQDFTINAGATLTSRYMANGQALSDGIAFQPYVEIETNGFYAGIWASNVSSAGPKGEVDIFFGYRNEVGNFSYDLGYVRYFDISPTGNCCGELYLDAGVQVSEVFSLGGRVSVDPSTRVVNASTTAGLSITEVVSVDMTVGKISKGGQGYAIVGATYQITPDFSATLAYHDSTQSRARAVLSFDYNFALQ